MFSDVLFEIVDGVGKATLNRPQQLNALTLDMVLALTDKLGEWAGDAKVGAVMLLGAGDKAFCAGGDVRALFEAKARGDARFLHDFFWHEYRLDHRVGTYPKPLIAVMDGLTMGGGAGLGLNAPIRVATERAIFSMPECSIGFFPDVGAGHFLNRCPGEIGLFLALTGQRLLTAGLSYCSLVTHTIEARTLDRLRPENLDALNVRTRMADIERVRPGIDTCFGLDTLAESMTILNTRKEAGARDSLAMLAKGAPLSLRVAYEHTRRSKGRELGDVLKEEWRLAMRFMERPDFFEGVRAQLIDRDNQPAWRPSRLEDVLEAEIEALFAPMEDWPELDLALN